MKNSPLPVTFIAGAIILGILAGLGLWYAVLQRKTGEIAAVDSGRGLGTSIPTFGGGLGSINTNISSSFSNPEGDGFEEMGQGTSTKEELATPAPHLWRLSVVPSAGVHAFTQTTSSSTLFYFVERVSGNIFSANPHNGKVTRITNTLIPYVYEAYWINEKAVILRSVGSGGVAVTFLGEIKHSTSSVAELVGDYLEPGITAVATQPETDSYFTLVPTASGYIGIATMLGKDSTRVWESIAGGWQVTWEDPEVLSLVQYGSEAVAGTAYTLPIHTKEALRPLIQSVAGLSASINKDGTAALFSESYVESLATFIKKSGVITPLSIKTLGEKCVWSRDSLFVYCAVPRSLPVVQLPDAWYRGEVHTSDDWYKVDSETGAASLMLSPENDFGVSVDVRNPSIEGGGEYITFIDSRTNTPWSLRIQKEE